MSPCPLPQGYRVHLANGLRPNVCPFQQGYRVHPCPNSIEKEVFRILNGVVQKRSNQPAFVACIVVASPNEISRPPT